VIFLGGTAASGSIAATTTFVPADGAHLDASL
jgi:hypothetical protein